MAEAAKRLPQIARDGPDVSALAADHLQFHMVGIGPGDHLKAFNTEGAGRKLHLHAVARKIIGAFAIHLHSRELGGHLHDLAAKSGQSIYDLRIARPLGARLDHCAFGIVRNGPFAEIDLTFPDGYTRSLTYRAGRFAAKDGSEVRSRKQGGVAIVTVNGEETFHIPDDVVMGW